MAAYAAASSLKITIQHIQQSSRISLAPLSSEILQPAYEAMSRLQEVLLKLDDTSCSKIRTEVNALDERIKEAAWEFEDLLESEFVDQVLPQLESLPRVEGDRLPFHVDLESLQHCVDNLVEKMTVMEEEYDIELENMPEEEGEPLSSRIDFGGINSKMVGISDQFEQVRDYLVGDEGTWLSVVGMAGVGKTTLAKKVFDDPSVQKHFEYRAWVKVGRKCEYNEILRSIQAQVDPNTHHQMITQGEDDDDDDKLVGLLEERLKDKKCLIVLDDVWEWDTRLMDNFPEENVQILVTSRLRIKVYPIQVVRLLNEEESKKLLGEKVFGEEGFPFSLEKLGEKIAKKCEGLPLMIVTVADLLSEEDKTLEYWTEVANKQHSSVFEDAYNQIYEVLFPSYDYLPQYLKMVFLYLGAYPPYSDIEIHNLFHRLHAEGFLEPVEIQTSDDFMDSLGDFVDGEQTLEDFMAKCSAKLAYWYHLVLLESNPESWFSKKEFRVHSCWQHLCKKEASEIKFLHVLENCDDDILRDQRRLCAHSNTLFAFKEVCDSIKSDCASTVRSLLCLGAYHQYPAVPIHDMDFKLLKVLDALKVRFYNVPPEFLKLVCLKYLALTCNKELPISISNLFHLQFLIVHPHMHIKKRGFLSYMPVEIWDMQELQHIEVLGTDLPTPNYDATLGNVSTLIGVSAKSCTREILKRIPNLKELGILIELKPYEDDGDDSNSMIGFDYISEDLHNLHILSYSVLNPNMKYEFVVPLSMFPSSLTTLELKGLGFPWRDMNHIGSLVPNLKDLRLEHYAFRGPEWDIESGCFLNLETLVIEDTDLVQWSPQLGTLPSLGLLSLRHCYKLKELNWSPAMITLRTIELVECNPLVVASSARQLRPESLFVIRCYSSF